MNPWIVDEWGVQQTAKIILFIAGCTPHQWSIFFKGGRKSIK